MPFSPKIISLPANWTQSRDNQPIRCIIAHDTERPSQDSNSINYLQRGGSQADGSDRKVSIHALIEPNGDIYEMVPDTLGANHAGFGTLTLNGVIYGPNLRYNINDISLGFELEYTKAPFNGPYPETQLLSMGWWVYMKRARYGMLPLFKHADVDPARRNDPRNLSVASMEIWVSNAARRLITIPTPDSPVYYMASVPQVVYIDRSLSSNFAGTRDNPLILEVGKVIPIGDITGEWAWIAYGWGFVPISTLVKV